ncbi:MAG: LPS export ABC transporter periplasmic protein LptC [Marinilabiliales bacterium]|nr:LPS export ABC transporter periplasmic protein LptC [Marinilabiliales bacterium]
MNEKKYSRIAGHPDRSSHLGMGLQWLLLLASVVLMACQTKVSTDVPPELLNTKKIASIEAHNFDTFYSDSGVVKYHLQSPKLLVYDDVMPTYKDFPDGFVVQRYDINKKIVSQLSGNRGKYYDAEKKWEAEGNVILINSQGDTLRSEELKYNELEDLIYSDKFVSIKKGDQYITGSGGFKSDSQMSRWTFIKTQGHMYVEGQ